MRVLGIESSCDETGLAIYDTQHGLMAHVLHSQADQHAIYGGVVPELASRSHIERITPLIKRLFACADCTPDTIDAVAFTAGPGLQGALMVGACYAQALAFAWQRPSIGVHHMEAHLLAVMLEASKPTFPFTALLVSGGHTLLVDVVALGQYRILGETLDDAVGEAFDKTAKILGLGYPGGPAIEQAAARAASTHNVRFSRPLIQRDTLDFSFSGLKTQVAQYVASRDRDTIDVGVLAQAFQAAAIDALTNKTTKAMQLTGHTDLVIAGGVGANQALRSALLHEASTGGWHVFFPRPSFCTDNGAMVAHLGALRLTASRTPDFVKDVPIRPRWPLDGLSKP